MKRTGACCICGVEWSPCACDAPGLLHKIQTLQHKLKTSRRVPAPSWRADVILEDGDGYQRMVSRTADVELTLEPGTLDPTQDYEIVIRKKVKR